MRTDGKNTFLRIGGNSAVMSDMLDTYDMYKYTPTTILSEIQNCDYATQIMSVWQYFNEKVVYREDEGNEQLLKTPARLLEIGYGDCKSFSIFFGACLKCLGIPFVFRFVGFSHDEPKTYTHVYVVALPYTSSQIILDAVERDENGTPKFNYARPFLYCKDIAG